MSEKGKKKKTRLGKNSKNRTLSIRYSQLYNHDSYQTKLSCKDTKLLMNTIFENESIFVIIFVDELRRCEKQRS